MLSQQEINKKLNALETDMNRLVKENERLIHERLSAYVELDSCVGLLAKMAAAHGLTTGVANQNTVVIELPSGQVSWEFAESESHLFETLPVYAQPIEDNDVIEKYRRVMNPGTL